MKQTGRELLGGNGILLENHIGRFVPEAEVIAWLERLFDQHSV
jgi:hypothetical protein